MRNIPTHIIFVSFAVFMILNFLENTIHFSIGRNIENKDTATVELKIPGIYDTIKIIIVMTIFGLLQGLFTYFGLLENLL